MSVLHLLHLLSEPPIPVAQETQHGWKMGEVVFAQLESASLPGLFIALDANSDGSVMALKLKATTKEAEENEEYVHLGLNMSEPGIDFASHEIRLNKIYFEGMFCQRVEGPLNSVVCHLSEPSMILLKNAVAQQWTRVMRDFPGSISSDANSPDSGVPEPLLNVEIDEANCYETFRSYGYHLERFLDLAYFALDKDDYRLIRDHLELPRVDFGNRTVLGCDCDGHIDKEKSDKKDLAGIPTFWTSTWPKLSDCALKLGIEGEALGILNKLSKAAYFLGRQPGEAVIHRCQNKPCYIANLPTELLLNIIESFSNHWDRDVMFNFGLTCKFFSDLVNINLYRSISISCDSEKWNKVANMLPKYGHLTREIYLEAPQWDSALLHRVVFQNLRAIGDFCPNIERLDLNYPLRLDLSATEADLPPKIGVEAEYGDIEGAGEPMAVDEENPSTDPPAPQPIDQIPLDAGDDDDGNDNGEDRDDDGDREAARQAALERERAQIQRRVCAELDHIIKNCKYLANFSIQWTGSQALNRFYKKIPKLKALRLWDRFMTDTDLITTGKSCPDLERFYLDGQDAGGLSVNGLVGLINALHTKGDSKLRRFGLYFPLPFRTTTGDDPAMMDDEDMDDDDDEDDEMDGAGENDGLDIEDDELPDVEVIPLARHFDVENLPICQFLNVLSYKHPYLERLALIGCGFTDDVVPKLGEFNNLRSLDLQHPIGRGLTAVGIARLVRAFHGKSLASLDLSYHTRLTEDDIDSLTGRKGLKTLRYIRVAYCPELKDKYLVDEWVHPSDFVAQDGTFKPRAGAGRATLEIGDGWKEPWNEN